MIIRTANRDIAVKSAVSEPIKNGIFRYPAIRFEFASGVTEEDIASLTNGSFEIIGDDGEVVGTHEGYTTARSISVVLEKITTADDEIIALNEELETVRAGLETAVQLLPDQEALKMVNFYPKWDELCENAYTAEKAEFKFSYNGKLYKTVPAGYTFVSSNIPGAGTESLFTRIDETHAGTKEDPIPYEGNMVLSAGLYYTQDGVTYLCTRDTGNPVYHALGELVGMYVEEMNAE